MLRIRNERNRNKIIIVLMLIVILMIGNVIYKNNKIKSLQSDLDFAKDYIEKMASMNKELRHEAKELSEQSSDRTDVILDLELQIDLLNKELETYTIKVKELEIERDSFSDGIVDYSDDRQFRKGYIDMSEIKVLQRIVEAEATGGDVIHKMNVARSVLNRVDAENFPNTISEVVFDKPNGRTQYTPTSDGRYWEVAITDSTVVAVDNVLNGECLHEALYFCARSDSSQTALNWFDRALIEVFNDGLHSYFIEK